MTCYKLEAKKFVYVEITKDDKGVYQELCSENCLNETEDNVFHMHTDLMGDIYFKERKRVPTIAISYKHRFEIADYLETHNYLI